MSAKIAEHEVVFTAVRSQGPGGQNVNKVSTAVQLRFDVPASSLPDEVKARLLEQAGQRRTKDGVIVIKAQSARSQERNKADALARLQGLVDAACVTPPDRLPTRPTRASRKRRLEAKGQRGELKAQRAKVAG
jgi:ribosome-associated protein